MIFHYYVKREQVMCVLGTVKITAQNHVLSCDDKSRFYSARTQRKEK